MTQGILKPSLVSLTRPTGGGLPVLPDGASYVTVTDPDTGKLRIVTITDPSSGALRPVYASAA